MQRKQEEMMKGMEEDRKLAEQQKMDLFYLPRLKELKPDAEMPPNMTFDAAETIYKNIMGEKRGLGGTSKTGKLMSSDQAFYLLRKAKKEIIHPVIDERTGKKIRDIRTGVYYYDPVDVAYYSKYIDNFDPKDFLTLEQIQAQYQVEEAKATEGAKTGVEDLNIWGQVGAFFKRKRAGFTQKQAEIVTPIVEEIGEKTGAFGAAEKVKEAVKMPEIGDMSDPVWKGLYLKAVGLGWSKKDIERAWREYQVEMTVR